MGVDIHTLIWMDLGANIVKMTIIPCYPKHSINLMKHLYNNNILQKTRSNKTTTTTKPKYSWRHRKLSTKAFLGRMNKAGDIVLLCFKCAAKL